MRAVVQRVRRAEVRIGSGTDIGSTAEGNGHGQGNGHGNGDGNDDGPSKGDIVGTIGPGLLVFVGVTSTDTADTAAALAAKLHTLRILPGERSAEQAGAPLLVVSQFTLYADTSRGRRPSWNAAAPGSVAEPLVAAVVDELRARGAEVATGVFGADMQVELVNDGPVTILLEL